MTSSVPLYTSETSSQGPHTSTFISDVEEGGRLYGSSEFLSLGTGEETGTDPEVVGWTSRGFETLTRGGMEKCVYGTGAGPTESGKPDILFLRCLRY